MLLDIDECDSSPCSANAHCNNTVGSFDCRCNDGFSGDGLNCSSKAKLVLFCTHSFVCVIVS